MYYTFLKRLPLFFLIFYYEGTAQNRIIDTSDYRLWPSIFRPQISNDGKYVLYYIVKNVDNSNKTLIMRSLLSSWEFSVPEVVDAKFDYNSKAVFYLKKDGNFFSQKLGHNAFLKKPNVESFYLINTGNARSLLYKIKAPNNPFIVESLNSNEKDTLYNIIDQDCDLNNEIVAFVKRNPLDSISERKLEVYSINKNSLLLLLSIPNVSVYKFNDDRNLVAYVRNKANPEFITVTSIQTKTELTVNIRQLFNLEEFRLREIVGFSKDNERLIVKLDPISPSISKRDRGRVNVWSYNDLNLQTEQLNSISEPSITAFINIHTHKVVFLQKPDERIVTPFTGSYIGIERKKIFGDVGSRPSFYLVNLSNTEIVNLPFKRAILSPNEKYVIGYDSTQTDLYAYEITSKKTQNLTFSIQRSNSEIEADLSRRFEKGVRFFDWINNGYSILFYDEHDIWRKELNSDDLPVSLTHGIGKNNNITFRFSNYHPEGYLNKREAIVTAFDNITKKNGYYKISLCDPILPKKLTMDNFIYEVPDDFFLGEPFIKAKDAQIFIVKRQSIDSSPNLFWTKDFEKFSKVSDVHPENQFIWMKSEKISFKTLDSVDAVGVLYKPDNFDSTLKYPIIIHYYEELSQNLNQFHEPMPSSGAGASLDIAWFVNHGYLVFTPDIHYKKGQIGLSAYNSILGAFHMLKKFKFVDSLKVGLQGHSLGGCETNYVIAHTNKFSAAVSSAGVVDFVSFYNAKVHGGEANQRINKAGQLRMGDALWNTPSVYIDNSPIFGFGNVITPTLIVGNNNDTNVPVDQAISMFLGFRRLGKRIWMLQYDNYDHAIWSTAMYDYLIRTTQFYDHFLKGVLPPMWMSQGVKDDLKRTYSGQERDEQFTSW